MKRVIYSRIIYLLPLGVFLGSLACAMWVLCSTDALSREEYTSTHIPDWVFNEEDPNKTPEEITGSVVYFWLNNSWKGFQNFCSDLHTFSSLLMEYDNKTLPLYYPEAESKSFKARLSKFDWMIKFSIVQKAIAVLNKYPEIGVIDISSQSAMFAMYAAMKGRQIIVVNPNVENILSVWKTIKMNGLSAPSTLFLTAPSDARRYLTLRRSKFCNIHPLDAFADAVNNEQMLLPMILLDDILPFVTFEKALLIMDGHMDQHAALAESIQLFHSLEVVGVLMELLPNYDTDKYEDVVHFLSSRDYSASLDSMESDQNYVYWTDRD